ncbi:MAG: HAMP domain-containing sensor histidine kinase, partial [Flavobacteriaceae bacterium]|nr:HAMP domain-containing sensor histidine kinase [Flavobacteriaceae bacterium]
MSKRNFIWIVLLMTIALVGIITVQFFWIRNFIEVREKQFSDDVKFALAKVADNIQQRELNEISETYSKLIVEKKNLTTTDIKRFLYQQVDTHRKESFTYAQTILEENYKVPIEFFEQDSILIKKIFSKKDFRIVRNQVNNNEMLANQLPPEERLVRIQRLRGAEKAEFEDAFKTLLDRVPLYKRVSNREIQLNLQNEFKARGITTNFIYGVYSNGLATKIKSDYFAITKGKEYMIPLFVFDEGMSRYQLYVDFPEERSYLLSTISQVLLLSIFFIFIIMMAFGLALYQLLEQKKISEIKTDFINNMTHEFKTPIATINLALDAIKNPKIIHDSEKVNRYISMIREENRRMNTQVENVLRISKLEKNQLSLSLEEVDIQDVIEEAITHLLLVVDDRQGYIKTHFSAQKSIVKGDYFHLINVFMNMLDNAIKYSIVSPKVDVYTKNETKYLVIKIVDQGMGMSKNVQKHIFDKFYREQKGNVHDIKGHGLGLSYVKKMIELHQGK